MATPSSHTSLLMKNGDSGISFASKSSSRKSGKVMCIACFLLFTVILSVVAYFNFGARFVHGALKNSSTARVLMTRDGKVHESGYVRQTREELVAEAIARHDEMMSDATQTTDYYFSDGEEDLIGSMPMLDHDSCSLSATSCEFKQYSGYLLATKNREIHYWFIEADDEDAITKPLFIWTNGGPGCSGLMGLLTEMGPWRVQDDGTVTYNANAWTTEINMVFLEQPYGVGFSVVDDDRDCVAGDDNAAWDMDAAIRNFLEKFPRYKDHAVYTTAESWGGHYVPRTAWQILGNNEAGYEPHINYRGFLLGNPYTNYYENTYGFVDSLFGHGLMNAPDYDYWKSECWDNEEAIDDSDACYAVYVAAYYSAYNSNVYALDWPQCYVEEDWTRQYRMATHIHRRAEKMMEKLLSHNDAKWKELGLKMSRKELSKMHAHLRSMRVDAMDGEWSIASDSYVACSEYNAKYWLARGDVQDVLNVKDTNWTVCSDSVYDAWPESDWYRFMETFYDDIITNFAEEKNLRMMIYSGDDDSVCGQSGTQYWLNRWDGYVRDDTVDWLPWRDDGWELGGYHTIYHSDDNLDFNALHFMTVRTAGHMVPTSEPMRALTVLKKYLYEISDYSTPEGEDGV